MPLIWNKEKTVYGLIQFGIILFLLSFSYRNIDKINNVFFAVPIGIIFSILIKQLYGIMKWYRIWINATGMSYLWK